MGASSEGSGKIVLGLVGGGVKEDRTDILGSGTSNTVAGAVDDDDRGITAIADLTRSIISGGGVYTK